MNVETEGRRGRRGRGWRVGGAYQVLVDDAVAGGKEGQDVRDEVPLLVLQRVPVLQVFGQIHLKEQTHVTSHGATPEASPHESPSHRSAEVLLQDVFVRRSEKVSLTPTTCQKKHGAGDGSYLLCGPERGLGLLVHLPDVVVLDGEDDEAARVLLQQRLLLAAALLHGFGLKHKHKRLHQQLQHQKHTRRLKTFC